MHRHPRRASIDQTGHGVVAKRSTAKATEAALQPFQASQILKQRRKNDGMVHLLSPRDKCLRLAKAARPCRDASAYVRSTFHGTTDAFKVRITVHHRRSATACGRTRYCSRIPRHTIKYHRRITIHHFFRKGKERKKHISTEWCKIPPSLHRKDATHHREAHVLLGVLEREGRVKLPVEDGRTLHKAASNKRVARDW